MRPTSPPCVTGCLEIHVGRVQGVEMCRQKLAVGVGARDGGILFGEYLQALVLNCSGWVPVEKDIAHVAVEVVDEGGGLRLRGSFAVDIGQRMDDTFHMQVTLDRAHVPEGGRVDEGDPGAPADAVVSLSVIVHRCLVDMRLPLLDVYDMYCMAWGLRPNKHVLRMLPDVSDDPTLHLHHLDLSGNYLGPIGVYPLFCTLMHCDELHIVDVSYVGMKADGLALLCSALAHHQQLHTLLISGNELFEASTLVVHKIVAAHKELKRVEWRGCHFSPTAVAKLDRRLDVNRNRYLSAHPAMVGALPLPPSHVDGLRVAWQFLTGPPYIAPEAAMVSARMSQFMVHIAKGFEVYKNPGVRALVAPRVDDLPVKQRIVSVNDVTFKSSLYSAMMIGVAEVLQTRGDAFSESTLSILGHLGQLFMSFGVASVHFTHFTTLSYDALLACGARDIATPLMKNSWQSALTIIFEALMPSPYPMSAAVRVGGRQERTSPVASSAEATQAA